MRPALPGRFEAIFYETSVPRFFLALRADRRVAAALCEPQLERAIGVIDLPETERASRYFHVRLSDQFDAEFHFDHTLAVEPLDRTAKWEAGAVPEPFTSGV